MTGARTAGILPSLDGWRALAILAVLMTHDAPWHIGPFTNAAWKGYGVLGVTLFFAISGLLICWRILEDEQASGKINLRSFYIRRFFRIQPAMIVYLSVVAILIALGAIPVMWRYWYASLFAYQNFLLNVQDPNWRNAAFFVGHFWSLAVEEHFYIILSLFLVICRGRRILTLSLLYLAIEVLQRLVESHGHFAPTMDSEKTYWVIQLLLFPALMALYLRIDWIRSAAEKWLQPFVVIFFTLAVMFLHRRLHHTAAPLGTVPAFQAEIGVITKAFPFWVVATMLHPKSWMTRFLELRPLRYVGRLSYSIYLWNVAFFSVTAPDSSITWRPLVLIGHRPWNYLGIALFSLASYYFVEKPFIRIGHKPRAAAAAHSVLLRRHTPSPSASYGGLRMPQRDHTCVDLQDLT